MAEFHIAEKITGASEGGYANHPDDRGGMTLNGIARNFWPKWAGWKRLDEIIKQVGENPAKINALVKKDPQLLEAISDFYKKNFWDANKLDQFNDQQIANTVYDFGVNSGTVRGATTLQQVLGVLADGVIGSKTLAALNNGNAKDIHTRYNTMRESFYRHLALKPSQKKFLKSWLSRLKPYVK